MTTEEARHILVALTHIRSGYNPEAVFNALAYNIGLKRIENIGVTVSYDPKIHHDTEGGILPNDLVYVIKSGWRFEHEVLLRAEVKKHL